MIDRISPGDLPTWLENQRPHGEAIVLDVREPVELTTASIQPEGFKLVTIPMGQLMERLQELDPAQPVAYFLASRGFAHVANITGGINAWSAQVDPRVPTY
jgi:rhodanese-related sulfurtransferase